MSQAQGTQIEAAARAAAEWWAEQIGAPVFRAIRGDEPDRQSQDFGAMTMMLGTILADRHPIREGQGEKFVTILAAAIAEGLDRNDYGLNLGVDYGPDRMLAEAAEAVGIHTGRFPYKTHMWIKCDHVTAALGYGAKSRLIWSAPDWERPTCGQHEYDANFNALDGVCVKPRYHEEDCGDYVPDPARCTVCAGTYRDHYGSREVRLNHSWNPGDGS